MHYSWIENFCIKWEKVKKNSITISSCVNVKWDASKGKAWFEFYFMHLPMENQPIDENIESLILSYIYRTLRYTPEVTIRTLFFFLFVFILHFLFYIRRRVGENIIVWGDVFVTKVVNWEFNFKFSCISIFFFFICTC